MPTKRTRRTRGRQMLTLDSFTGHDLLCFVSVWSPPRNEADQTRSRWANWREFLAEYEEVRDELLLSGWGRNPVSGALPFAERVYQRYGLDGPLGSERADV